MDLDASQVATSAMPFIAAVVVQYGRTVLENVRDSFASRTSDAVASVGERMLGRLLQRDDSRQAIESAVEDLADGEDDAEAALRLQVRKALTADSELLQDIAELLSSNNGLEMSGRDATNIGSQHNYGSGIFVGRDYNGASDAVNQA